MRDLELQEQFELEALDLLRSGRILDKMVFTGGTMLRLCFGLNRFSLDLDFWLVKKTDAADLFAKLGKILSERYEIRDRADKFNTILFEIRSPAYPSKLKIEIRKQKKNIRTEPAIAYSRFSDTQVLLRVASPDEMMKAKLNAFLDRGEIRDVFDMEFLLKKGVIPDAPPAKLKEALGRIKALAKNDYSVKLGSLLPADQRKYYCVSNFRILCSAINDRIAALRS